MIRKKIVDDFRCPRPHIGCGSVYGVIEKRKWQRGALCKVLDSLWQQPPRSWRSCCLAWSLFLGVTRSRAVQTRDRSPNGSAVKSIKEAGMPRLRYFNKHTSVLPDHVPYWVVLYTTAEDLQVTAESPELREQADEPFLRQRKAHEILNVINDRANKIRNPPRG